MSTTSATASSAHGERAAFCASAYVTGNRPNGVAGFMPTGEPPRVPVGAVDVSSGARTKSVRVQGDGFRSSPAYVGFQSSTG